MKKKLALLLAATMVAGMVPATVFAGVTNRITKTVSVTQDSYVTDSSLVIEEKDGDFEDATTYKFALNLAGAKWAKEGVTEVAAYESALEGVIDGTNATEIDVKKITDTMVTVAFKTDADAATNKPKLVIPMLTQVTGAEEATVSIDRMESPVKNETLTFATIISGSTTVSIESKVTVDTSAKEIKPIIIKENVAGTIKEGSLKLKLAGDFEFKNSSSNAITVAPISGSVTPGEIVYSEDTITIPVSSVSGKVQMVISGLDIEATSDAAVGDVAEVTVSGAGVASATLEVATYAEYDVAVTVEDKDLPVIYAGTANTTKTLKVTLKEAVADSWLANRKTTFTFSEGVKIVDITVDKNTGIAAVDALDDFSVNKNVATLSGLDTTALTTLTLRFTVNVAPDFEGDIKLTVGGASLAEDTELTVATVKPLVTVETEVNEAIIDYRNTAIGEITITETKAGNLAKGKTLYLEAEDMQFEDGTKYEVVEGDIKIESVKVNKGQIAIKVKSESVKTPAVIKLSNMSLYMSRNLPAGDYRLYTVKGTDGIGFETFATQETIDNASTVADKAKFTTESVTLMDDFVKIVTAGRDQDDSTFTTTVKVTIGATTMTAGKNTIALDAPAYISNGYTMLPVRAVAEALSGSAQVSWDDATKTVIIFFGSRIIKMTIGSKEMIINGTATPMSAAAEITNSRTFIPLRDLGYALGLSDNKISWDDATKTATLN